MIEQKIVRNELLARHTTLRIGGPAEYFDWLVPLKNGTLDRELRNNFTIPGYIFYLNCEQAGRYRIMMLSDLNAQDAAEMGIEILTEEQYRELQKLGEFDTKTSSWVKTPADIRKLGGALFCDRRYNTVFVYHNGAESYYGGRAFRGSLKV